MRSEAVGAPHARRRFIAAAALALHAAPACALMAGRAPDSPRQRLDRLGADSPHACVASLMGLGGVYSAVCIAPNWALTAAHVSQPIDGVSLYLNLERDLSHRLPIRRIVRHPLAERGIDRRQPVGDLALLELAAPVPAAVALPPLATTPLAEGQRIELVGYGASGAGDGRVSVAANPALRRVGANRVDRVLRSDDAARRPLIYLFGFDAPERGAASLGNAVETGLAGGDSGSPAFVREHGRLAVAGINTFVTGDGPGGKPRYTFGSVGGGQVLAGHRDWLLAVLGPGVWRGLD